MLMTFLLFAQAFIRPHMPIAHEKVDCKCIELNYQGDFVMPKDGYRLDYQKFYPGTYDGTVIRASPTFDDQLKPGHGNQLAISVLDESYDHITVKAKQGSHWHYTVTIAVPKPEKRELH
jgi:hypothetical protein